jgi:hypothetical protein
MRDLILVSGLLTGLYVMGCGSSRVTFMCESNAGMAGHVCEINDFPGHGTPFCGGDDRLVESCPTTNRLGTCFQSAFGGDALTTVTTIYYADGWPTAAAAEADCMIGQDPGKKWTPGG